MDEEFKRERRRRRLFLLVGLVLAVAASLVTFKIASDAQHGQGGTAATRLVLVAARDIPARTVIAASDLTEREVPDDPSLAKAITDPHLAIGRITGVDVLFQEPITPNLLASSEVGGQFSILGPTETVAPGSPALRAISINVPDDRAVGGEVQVGSHVDVFVTVQVNVLGQVGASAAPAPAATTVPGGAQVGGYYTDKSTKVVYQDMLVLAKNGTLYVLRVDEKTAEEISHLQAAGNATFSLALRPEQDDRQVDTKGYGETTNGIIEEYGLPIPQVYPKP